MRFSELDGAAIGVWGAGREISSFARQLARTLPNARIVAIALDAAPDPAAQELIAGSGARLLERSETVAELSRCDVVVRSPGVPANRPELRALRDGGTPVTTATALWLAERGGANVIGITGTKGKSTTAALAAHLARAGGQTVHLAGNIGVPALELLGVPAEELAVIELSSYQIADLVTGPEVAVVTNLYREHLDWHGSEEAYQRDKLRLLTLPGVRAVVVEADGDERVLAAARASGHELSFFGGADGWHVTAEGIAFGGPATGDARSEPAGDARRDTLVVPTAQLPLPGRHNALNLCAALTALAAAGIAPPSLPPSLEGFSALPHRLQVVTERDGVLWVDDSISTTPESASAAIEAYPSRDVVLLGGGQDRGQDYATLGSLLAARGAAVVGLPTTGPRLVAAARAAGVPADRALDAPDMVAAVARARELARAGTVVLLSPAAPSYDSYRNFEQRGDHFGALVEGTQDR